MSSTNNEDWASTPQFRLSAKDSKDECSIHKGLLDKVAPVIASSEGFKEGNQNHYVFEETSQNTLNDFVNWAYNGTYTSNSKQESKSGTSVNGTELLAHGRIYIFASVYLIDELKELAYTSLTESLQEAIPKRITWITHELHRDLVALLAECFSGQLPDDDKLMIWLGELVAWRIEDFQSDQTLRPFLPQMAVFVLPYVKGRNDPPWDRFKKPPRANPRKPWTCINCRREYAYHENECPGCRGYDTLSD
ncbi:MAG: hypothetical protein Q9227_004215 [Pyrenula ochraceoflavens]